MIGIPGLKSETGAPARLGYPPVPNNPKGQIRQQSLDVRRQLAVEGCTGVYFSSFHAGGEPLFTLRAGAVGPTLGLAARPDIF